MDIIDVGSDNSDNDYIAPAEVIADSSVVSTHNKKKRSKTSFVWVYFQQIDDNQCECQCVVRGLSQICGAKLVHKQGESTGNLRRHLETHGILPPTKDTKSKQAMANCNTPSTVTSTLTVSTAGNKVVPRKQMLINFDSEKKQFLRSHASLVFDPVVSRKLLVDMIVDCELPFRFTDKNSFKEFIFSLNPDYAQHHIGRKTVASDVDKKYSELLVEVKTILKSEGLGRFSFTTDVWTSGHQTKSYMAITVHFINRDWKLVSFVLNFKYFKAPHTGIRIAEVYI